MIQALKNIIGKEEIITPWWDRFFE